MKTNHFCSGAGWRILLIALLFVPALFVHAQETTAIVSEAGYEVTLSTKDASAKVTFNLKVNNYRDALSEVIIGPAGFALEMSKLPTKVLLASDARYHKLLFDGQGEFQINGVFSLPVAAENGINRLTLPLVRAVIHRIEAKIPSSAKTKTGTLLIPESLCARKQSGDLMILNITPPAGAAELDILWGPEEVINRPAGDAPVDIASSYNITEGLITSSHYLKLPGPNSIPEFSITLPADTIVTGVNCPRLDSWFIDRVSINNKISNILHIRLRSPASDAREAFVACLVDLERRTETIEHSLVFEPPQTDFAATKGRMDIVSPLEIILDITNKNRVVETDAPHIADRNCLSYNYSNPDCAVTVMARRKKPEISTAIKTLYNVRQKLIMANAEVSLSVKNIGIHALDIHIPAGILNVSALGEIIKSYQYDNGILNVAFRDKIIGDSQFALEYEQQIDADDQFNLLPFKIENTAITDNIIVIKADTGISVTSIARAGLDRTGKSESEESVSGMYLQATENEWSGKFHINYFIPAYRVFIQENIGIDENTIKREIRLLISSPYLSEEIEIPEGWTIQNVSFSDISINDWNFTPLLSLLTISFANPPIMAKVDISLRQPITTDDTSQVSIRPIQIKSGERKVNSTVYELGFSAEENIEIKTAPDGKISEIEPTKLSRSDGTIYSDPKRIRIAFKSETSKWDLGLNIKTTLPSIRAGIYTGLVMREGQISALNRIRYNIRNGQINTLRVQLPPDSLNYQITGDGIKDIAKLDNNIREIKLASRISGDYSLLVNYDIASATPTQMAFIPIRLPDVILESGLVMLSRGNDRTEIKVHESRNISVIPEPDKPAETEAAPVLKQLPFPPLQFLTYTQPDARAVFDIKTYELSVFLPAKILSCDLFSLVRQSGEMVTYVSTSIENTAKQYLTVNLPASTELWGTYIDDKPVKPITKLSNSNSESEIANRKSEILIPLMPEKGKIKQEINLVFVYVQRVSSLANLNKLDFQMPGTDLNVEKATWHFFLPEKHYLGLPQGNMDFVYYDPVITYPSLGNDSVRTLVKFINKLWLAVPVIAKKTFFVIIISVFALLILAWALRAIFAYLAMRQRVTRAIIYTGCILLLFFGLLTIITPGMGKMRSKAMALKEVSDNKLASKVEEPVIMDYALKMPAPSAKPTEQPADKIAGADGSGYSNSNQFTGDVQQLRRMAELSKESRANKNAPSKKQSMAQQLAEVEKKLEEQADAETNVTTLAAPQNINSIHSGRNGAADRKTIKDSIVGKQKDKQEARIDHNRLDNGYLSDESASDPTATPAQPRGEIRSRSTSPTGDNLQGQLTDPQQSLQWSSGTQSEGHDIYFGSTSAITSKPKPAQAQQKSYGSFDWRSDWVKNYQSEYAAQSTPEKTFGKTEKGRFVGALPLTVSVPLEDTYYYAFESQHLGRDSGHIGFYCFSAALALFLQLLCWLVIIAILFLAGRGAPKYALYINYPIVITCLFGFMITGGLAQSVFTSGFWFSLVTLAVLTVWYFLEARFEKISLPQPTE